MPSHFLGVPKLAREIFIIRNDSTLKTCQIKTTAPALESFLQNKNTKKETNEPVTDNDLSENSKQPQTTFCKTHYNNNSLPEERANQSSFNKPLREGSSFDTKGSSNLQHERQHATKTNKEEKSCEHLQGKRQQLLGYESSVCSTDVEAPRRKSELKSKIHVLYQSSFDSSASDSECDWYTFSDRPFVKPAEAQVNERSKLSSGLAKHSVISDSKQLKHVIDCNKENKHQLDETTGENNKQLVIDLKSVTEAEQYFDDYNNSFSSGLGTDSLQRLNAQSKRVCSPKSQISIESSNSYSSLRSGFLAGEEDNGEGLTDEDERKKHFEKKKKKNSNKQLTNNIVIEINSSQRGTGLSSGPIKTKRKESASQTAQEEDGAFPISEHDRTSGGVSTTVYVDCFNHNASGQEENASAGSESTAENGHLQKDSDFTIISVEEQQIIEPDSRSPKVKRIEDAKAESLKTYSIEPDQCISNKLKPTSNNNLCTKPLRLRILKAMKERYGRSIYQSIELNEDEQGNREIISV